VRSLEGRNLVSTLADAAVPGNAGQILSSQFQPYGYEFYGAQLWDVVAARGRTVRLDTPFNFGPPAPIPDGWVIPTAPANTGLIDASQFDTSGFSTLGFQMRSVSIGGAFVINALEEGLGRDAWGGSPAATIGPRSSPAPIPPTIPDAPTSSGAILASQFNDGGFGNLGLQWGDVSVGGDLDVSYNSTVWVPDGSISLPSGGAAPPPSVSPTAIASTITGYVQASQFNDGGFGNLGLQWSGVAVAGGVDLSADRVVYQPQAPGSPPTPVPPIPDGATASATNTGHLVGSQFNDGGFGQIGFQWSGVKIGGAVATANNALIVQPERDGFGAITVGPRSVGQEGQAATALAASTVGAGLSPSAVLSATATPPTTNGATNSGTVLSSQFSDGGFGDIGLQWQNVAVAGSVSAVHNQLVVQPENTGQGLISISGISFPGSPGPPGPAPSGAAIPTYDPALIPSDGRPVTTPLPTPTGPGDTSFHINEATNSGNVTDTQFSDGGFGDVGLQWRDVNINGNVEIVHNSLSVQPEGSGLAGVNVSGVRFGQAAQSAVAATPNRRTTLRRMIVPSSPGPRGTGVPKPPVSANNRANLNNRQFLSARARDVTLQWDTAAVGADGLVIVHNVLTVQNHGPRSAAVVLKNIKFAGAVPPRNFTPNQRAAGNPLPLRPTTRPIDAATNSGTINSGQFLDGGTGDVGLQWRGVSLGDDVRIVHNSLSVNVDADATNNGPVSISDVTFNSGLPADLPAGSIISPPRYFSRMANRTGSVSANAAQPGVINRATNSGAITGGQFLSGGMGQVGLQWLGVDRPGPVTIVNNVLSVQVFGSRTGRVTIENISYQ
jgi:hypothetical protein